MTGHSNSATKASVIKFATYTEDDAGFIEALKSGERSARAQLFHRYVRHVERILFRVVGWNPEIPDLVQEVFLQVLSSLEGFRGDSSTLMPWITRIAVYTARGWIRKRRVRKWLRFEAPEELPEIPTNLASPEQIEMLRRTYRIIEKLPVNERIPFTLRFIEDMELLDIAKACNISLATVKRRLDKARSRFSRLAYHDSYLREYLDVDEDL